MFDAPRLGIDFGGTVVPLAAGRPSLRASEFAATFPTTPPYPGAVAAIRLLVSAFAGRVWIVSKAGERMEALTWQWLNEHDFFRRTGLAEEQVRFCLERTDKQSICRDLGISHFLDDRIAIMQILRGTVGQLYLFDDRARNNRSIRHWATPVVDWSEATTAILRSLQATSGER